MFKNFSLISLMLFHFLNCELNGSALTEAEKYYLQGDYHQAISFLQKEAAHRSNFLIDYNLGLCYWQLGDYYQARKYLLRAMLRDSSDSQLINLLKKVDQKLGLSENSTDFLAESILVQKIRFIFSGTTLKIALWISFYLLNLFVFFALAGKKFYYKTFGLVTIIFLVFFIIALSGYRQEKIIKRGIVTEDTFLLAQPEERGVRLDRVKRAMALKVIQHQGDWLQVLVENRYAGWIIARKVEIF